MQPNRINNEPNDTQSGIKSQFKLNINIELNDINDITEIIGIHINWSVK